MKRYATTTEVKECLAQGGHVAITWRGTKRPKCCLVWGLYKTTPMKKSQIERLEAAGVIEPKMSKTDKYGWETTFLMSPEK